MKGTILLILTVCFFSNKLMADSPLTSIEFWKASEDSYVLKIGKKPGKKKMDKRMFNYLMSDVVNVYEKYALINALGWEFNSKLENSKLFLNKLKDRTLNVIKENLTKDSLGFYSISSEYRSALAMLGYEYKWESINALNDDFRTWSPRKIIDTYSSIRGSKSKDIYTLYLYLLAMDGYSDVTFVYDELSSVDIHNDFDSEVNSMNGSYSEPSRFLEMLVSSQYILTTKGIQCGVWEEYEKYQDICDSNYFIKKALPICYKYLKNYSSNCDRVNYNIAGYFNGNVIHVNQNQEVWIVNYPVFVYGELTVYDQNNSEVFKTIINGGDYALLDISKYAIGNYSVKLVNTESEPEINYNLELIVYPLK